MRLQDMHKPEHSEEYKRLMRWFGLPEDRELTFGATKWGQIAAQERAQDIQHNAEITKRRQP